jgi:hypothetical protein
MLRPISREGHVYTNTFDLAQYRPEGPVDVRLKGIRDTSVFNGFCAFHDKKLFEPIEDRPFVCSLHQLFLHAFRAVAKESFLKRSQVDTTPSHEGIAQIHGLPEGAKTEFGLMMELHQAVATIGAEEVEKLKTRLDEIHRAQEWSRLVSTVIPFSQVPTVATNFVYAPDFDFEGNYLQDFENLSRPLDHLMVTITPAGKGGFALLSHLDDAGTAPRQLIASLLRRPNVTTSLIWLVIAQAENTAFSPNWYESLTDEMRAKLKSLFVSNADPLDMRHNQLKNCPDFIADWNADAAFVL